MKIVAPNLSGAAQWLALSIATVLCRFVLSQELVASAVIGACSPAQLVEITASAQKGPLDLQTLEAIDDVHEMYPNPAP